MTVRPDRFAWLSALVLLTACKSKSPVGATASATPESPAYADFDELVVQLEQNEAELAALGIQPQARPAGDRVAMREEVAEADAEAPSAGAAEPAPAPEPAEAPDFDDAGEEDVAMERTVANAPAHRTRQRRNRRREKRRRGEAEQSRCERLETLAEVACGLEDRICDLADEHAQERRYERACERAAAQCQAATEAVDRCEP